MAAAVAITSLCLGQDVEVVETPSYRHPDRYVEAIQNFEAADLLAPPRHGEIVFTGSSSMSGWKETIEEDFAPLVVILRGYGGSNLNDAGHYADRVVLPYKPRAVVLYAGENDLAQGIPLETVVDKFRLFVEKVHREQPQCRIYFLSLKPSIKRWNLWPIMQEANRLFAEECAKDERLMFVDVATGMLDDQGYPKKELFKEDDLHMKREGYAIWRDALRPILMNAEGPFIRP